MTTATKEQTFKVKVSIDLNITKENLDDLICTIGQGAVNWCDDFSVGHLPVDENNVVQLENDQWSKEGCAAWNHDIKEDSPIEIHDYLEDETFKKTVKDLIEAIRKLCAGETETHESYCKIIREAFITDDLGLIDAYVADIIAQTLCFGRCDYG